MAGIKPRRPSPQDPKQIFLNGDNFSEAAKILFSDSPQNPNVIAPACAVAALATELLLKSLIAFEGVHEVPRAHAFDLLYALIDPATRDKIEVQWAELMAVPEMAQRLKSSPSHKMELGACLADSRNSFANYRFIYDPDRHVTFTVGSLPHLLRHIILSMHPDWRPSSQTSPGDTK